MTHIAPHHPMAPRNGRPARVPVVAPSAVAPAASAVSAAPATPRRPARPSLFVAPAIVVLGRDERGKPHASWFGEADVRAAERAAQLMGMRSLAVVGSDEALGALAARLPSGRLFESGRAFVPFVKGELYDQLAAYLPGETERDGAAAAAGEALGEADALTAIAATPKRKGGRRKAAATESATGDTDADAPSGDDGDGGNHDGGSGDGDGKSDDDGNGDGDGSDDDASAPDDGHRPTGWPAIRLGSLVLATEGAAEGWFEAIVDQALENENFILRWRDWPDEPHFARNRNQLALLPTGRLTWAKRS